MARRTLILTTMTTTAALLLTACGGGGKTDGIKGADKGSSSPSVTPSSDTGGPDMSLPGDLHVEFDAPQPSDARKAAALDNAKNYILALNHGIIAQNPNDPAYQYYSLGNATQYAKNQIQAWMNGKWTATGTDSYFKVRTDGVGTTGGVLVTMCRDQSKFYGKNVETKKIKYTQPSLADYQEYRLLMSPPKGSQRLWKVLQIQVQGQVKGCQR
ncbi:hypothetical protein ACWDBD_23720 [Streptomyces sp. NPDC001118]